MDECYVLLAFFFSFSFFFPTGLPPLSIAITEITEFRVLQTRGEGVGNKGSELGQYQETHCGCSPSNIRYGAKT
jgi:hypothetical protein